MINLIEEMVKCGHRDYAGCDMDLVKKRAVQLHTSESAIIPGEQGQIPTGVYTVISKNASEDKDKTGKISVPPDVLTPFSKDTGQPQADALKDKRVVGVGENCSGNSLVDLNMQLSSAMNNISEKLGESGAAGEECPTSAAMNITMGEARNQFEATFFLTAYAFLFPFSVGAPDLKFQKRDRRTGPRVDFSDDWCPTLMQRAEGQFRRDLTLPFALWNLTFRTVINVGHNLYSIKRAAAEGSSYSAADFATAAENISMCLAGTFITASGIKLKVNGDLRKLRTALKLEPPLSPLAKRMLDSFQATCKRIEGTQEVRSMMRHELNGYRVYLGRPIMVTMSPNERHNALMIKFSRVRRSDPMSTAEVHGLWGSLTKPELIETEEVGEVNFAAFASMIPESDERRSILAKDPLASVYGFRMLCKIMLKTLFGVRVCPNCPDCNHKEGGCVDLYGSVAECEGGVFGRVDGYYGSIENQKEDSQHLHGMYWLQCMHQHMTLQEISDEIQANCKVITQPEPNNDDQAHSARVDSGLLGSNAEAAIEECEGPNAAAPASSGAQRLLEDCYQFKSYVCAESYADPKMFEEQRSKLEEASPDYKDSARLICQQEQLRSADGADNVVVNTSIEGVIKEGKRWKQAYKQVVQQHQMRVNHHLHLLNDEGEREPMPYCRSKTDHNECSKGYPRQTFTFKQQKGAAICRGAAKKLKLSASGKKCMLGAIFTGRENEWLNGTHPAFLASLHCNSDVLVPYRLPLIPETHSKELCDIDDCLRMHNRESVMNALEQSQRDCIGYITDYITKRQPIATNEVDRFIRGHRELMAKLRGGALSTAAIRHTQRLLSDVLGRGTVRKAVECTNLMVCRKKHDVTAAESIKSHLLVPFPCGDYMRCQAVVCSECKDVNDDGEYDGLEVDRRNPRMKALVSKVRDVVLCAVCSCSVLCSDACSVLCVL